MYYMYPCLFHFFLGLHGFHSVWQAAMAPPFWPGLIRSLGAIEDQHLLYGLYKWGRHGSF